MIVIATTAEIKLIEELLGEEAYSYYPIVITGVGGTNICKNLRNVPLDTTIINIGYAGSANTPIGTVVDVECCQLYHPNVKYNEPFYQLKLTCKGSTMLPCYTSNDFVLQSDYHDCVFDMELAYICAMGFKNVCSLKVVSDNLSLHEYDQTTGDTNVVQS